MGDGEQQKGQTAGWRVLDIDGHDHARICDALAEAERLEDQPTVILARTLMGKGVPSIEDRYEYHGKVLTREQCGIQEHCAATVAGAASKSGVLSFFADFGVFGIDETYNQHRLNDMNETSLKLICTHCGLDVGEDGKTNQCIDYIGLAANLNGFKLIIPADANQADRAVRYMASTPGRFVLAMGRSATPIIGDEDGTRPTLFESQAYSESALQKKLAQMVVPMDLDSVFQRVEAVSPDVPEVKRVMEEITGSVEMCEITEESLVNMARFEVALVRIAEELDVDALAVNCWTGVQERFHISVCSTLGRLNDRGIITACEADLMGAVSMYAVHGAALGKHKPHFIDWTDLHPAEPNVWLAWHCGNAPASLCASGCKQKMYRNERMIQWNPQCHGAVEFNLRPGPVTCARMMEYDGEFSMFFGTGEVIDIKPFVRGT